VSDRRRRPTDPDRERDRDRDEQDVDVEDAVPIRLDAIDSLVASIHRVALVLGLGLGTLLVDVAIAVPDGVVVALGVATIVLPWVHPTLLDRARDGSGSASLSLSLSSPLSSDDDEQDEVVERRPRPHDEPVDGPRTPREDKRTRDVVAGPSRGGPRRDRADDPRGRGRRDAVDDPREQDDIGVRPRSTDGGRP
jgi:hypothetical protein